MQHLEPTYLRYIYDGLIKGSIHPENAAELPEGLIGLYEEAFDERTSVVERQKLLQRFAVWALLKKEVSTAFVAEVLGDTEDEIQEFISTYSAWFNSPESGKYQLYHERLKVFLLQKMSDVEIHELHEKLITRLEHAMEEQKADEFEWYGLEFLAGHLSVVAMLNGDGYYLIDLAYSQEHWQRQLKISKGYSWTKNGLKEVMSWASKYFDDEVIECGLQMVDLHHQEQNSAPQIVALVAEGDFDSALKRIEQFGGNDKQGLQRKFILYMLCLMELTLLDGKDKPYRKVGIKKLLKHLDEQLPVDLSMLNWNNFFPSYLMFQMATEIAKLDLNYSLLYKFSNNWEDDWFFDRFDFNELELEIIQVIIQEIDLEISKCYKYLKLISFFNERNQFNRSQYFIKILLSTYIKLNDSDLRSIVLEKISIEYIKQNEIPKALDLVNQIENLSNIESVFSYLAIHQTKRKNYSEGNEFLRQIQNRWKESDTLLNMAFEMLDHGNQPEFKIKMENALKIVRDSELSDSKITTLVNYSNNFWLHEKFLESNLIIAEAKNLSRKFQNNGDVCLNLLKISKEKILQGKIDEAELLLYEIKTILEKIEEDWVQEVIAEELCIQFVKIDNIDIIDDLFKKYNLFNNDIVFEITQEYIKNDRINEFHRLLNTVESDDIKEKVNSFYVLTQIKNGAYNICSNYKDTPKNNQQMLLQFSLQYSKIGEIKKSLFIADKIDDKYSRENLFMAISSELAKKGWSENITHCLNKISSLQKKAYAYLDIHNELIKFSKGPEIDFMLRNANETAINQNDSDLRSIILEKISIEYIKQNKMTKALDLVSQIENLSNKESVFSYLAIHQTKCKNYSEGNEFLLQIQNRWKESYTLLNMAFEMLDQGNEPDFTVKMENALKIVRDSELSDSKITTLVNFSHKFWLHEKFLESNLIIAEAKNLSRKFQENGDICLNLLKISEEEVAKGKNNEAELIFNEIEAVLQDIEEDWVQEVIVEELCRQYVSINKINEAYLLAQNSIDLDSKLRLIYEIEDQIGRHILNKGFDDSFRYGCTISNNSIKIYYFKVFLKKLNFNNINLELVKKYLNFFKENLVNYSTILELYCLNQLFFEDLPMEKRQRYNRTLNLQWAIDIKNQLPN